MYKIIKLVVGVLMVLCFVAQAQENKFPTVTVSSRVADKYLAMTGTVLSNDVVIQSDLCVSFQNGVYIDLWNSRNSKGSWNNGSFGNEIDYSLGWNGQITEKTNLSVGMTYFDEPNAFTFGKGDIIYSHLFLSKDFKLLSITGGFENFVAMPNSGFKGGNFLNVGVSNSCLLYEGKMSIQTSVKAVYDTGTMGTGSGLIMKGNIGVDWKVGKKIIFHLIGSKWQIPLTVHDRRKVNMMVYSGITFNVR